MPGSSETLPLASIQPDPDQPRKQFDRIDDLAASIATHGLLQPIVVRPVAAAAGAPGHWKIVAGERRYRACQSLGWERVPVVILPAGMGSAEVFELSVLENLARADMTATETARALQRLVDLGMEPEAIEKRLGYGQGDGNQVRWKIRLLDAIEEVQHLVDRDQLPYRNAVVLAKLSRNGQLRALREFQKAPLTFRQFSSLCDAIYAEENQLAMFDVDTVAPQVRDEGLALARLVAQMAPLAARLQAAAADPDLPAVLASRHMTSVRPELARIGSACATLIRAIDRASGPVLAGVTADGDSPAGQGCLPPDGDGAGD